MVRYTVDVETDWGGRSASTLGIKYGIPKLLELFRTYKVKGLFFISTELLSSYKEDIKKIIQEGHEIGSHGHFHIVWKDQWRAWEDRRLSNILLTALTGKERFEYRAPKFSWENESVYSRRANHVGLLKSLWFGDEVREDSIFYLHPFDIIDEPSDAPNLFCRAWYSRPRDAYKRLVHILSQA